MGAALRRMLSIFWTRKLEVVLVGLENSGKTTLLSVLSNGVPVQTAPTIGLNVKLIKRNGVQFKCWDLGGQLQYRQEWGRYTRGCNVILFVVDTNATDKLVEARAELNRLLEDKELATTPVLIVANKIDLEPHVSEQTLIRELNLDYITDNPWIIIPCSALKTINIDEIVQWLIKQSQ
jgi:ADP-ribosylation factor-like protein 8